jgi:hypothetical protein
MGMNEIKKTWRLSKTRLTSFWHLHALTRYLFYRQGTKIEFTD